MSAISRFQPTFRQKLLSITLLMLLLLTGCGVSDTSTGQASTSTPSIEPTYDWLAYEAGQNTNPTPTLGITQSTAYAEVALNRTAVARNWATSDALPTAFPDDGRPIETPWPTPILQQGIYNCDSINRAKQFFVWSCWREIHDDTTHSVHAGGKYGYNIDDIAGPSGVNVCTGSLAQGNGQCSDVFWNEHNEGSLKIVAVTWPHITVESLVGTRYGFNADTLMWEAPQAVPPTATLAPTNTPLPTATPTALPTNTPTARPTNTPTNTPTPLSTATATALPTSTALPAVTNAAVRPVLECVRAEANGQYTAFFGYKNDNTAAVTIAVGTNNRFSPNPQARGQTTQFASGRQVSVFGVAFDGTNLVWSLKGPDGQNRTATAASGSKRCAP